MKSLFIIFFILFNTIVLGQEYRIEYGNKKFMKYHYLCSQDNGFTLKKKLKDGKYIVYSKTYPEVTIIEAYYKNRKETGIWTYYNQYTKEKEFKTYDNGNLISENIIDSLNRKISDIKYENGHAIGKQYGYFYGNKLKYLDEFDNDKLKKINISLSTYYYENGNIKKVYKYKNGNSHGKCFEYYENGQLAMEFENFEGKQVGLWKWWNEKGELIKEKDYGL